VKLVKKWCHRRLIEAISAITMTDCPEKGGNAVRMAYRANLAI
jgi:hypothetical protein